MGVGIEPVEAADAAAPGAHYSQGMRSGDCVWTAGAVGTDPETGAVVDGFEAQVERAIENVRATLRAAGSDLEHVVKTTCFLADMSEFSRFNEVYGEFFPTDPPARSTVGVTALPRAARVELEAVAIRRGV